MQVKQITQINSTDIVIIPCFEADKFSFSDYIKPFKKYLKESFVWPCSKDFSGKKDQMTLVYTDSKKNPRIFFVGCGKKENLSVEDLRILSSKIEKQINTLKIEKAVVYFENKFFIKDVFLKAFLEGFVLSSYNFSEYRTKKHIYTLKNLEIFCNDKKIKLKAVIEESLAVLKAVFLARNLVNTPSNEKFPEILAKVAKSEIKGRRIKLRVHNEKHLKSLKMGAVLAVGQGSKYPPRIIEMSYKSRKKGAKTIVLLGKAVTFDTGGINLKIGASSIETMKMDMAGGALVIALFKILSQGYDLPVNLVGLVGAAENMIGSDAVRPGDIITSYSGKTVEITNTDAEGRLVLADCLAYAEKKLKPDYMIDVATLTGSCIAALGYHITGIMGTSSDLIKKLLKSSEETGEMMWELPIKKHMLEATKSDVADLKNYSSGVSAGSSMGGAFLNQFVKNTAWIHIDIAGTAWSKGNKNYLSAGGTGVGVRTIWELLKEF